MPTQPFSIAECRTLLGEAATGKSDDQIKAWRDSLTVAANQIFDHLQSKIKVDPDAVDAAAVHFVGFPPTTQDELERDALERIRWIAYAHESPLDEETK